MIIDCRKMNKKISICSIVRGKDADGFATEFEALITSCRAMVKTTSGYTLIKNDSDFEKAMTNFTVRYNADIKRNQIIKYGTRKYRIDYCNNIDEEGRYLELQAIEVTK